MRRVQLPDIYRLDDTALVKLSCGRETIIDANDIPLVASFYWYMENVPSAKYVMASVGGKRIWLHRHLTNCPAGMVVDHINHDPLDNRRANLRICTQKQNSANRSVGCNSKTGLKGVSPCGRRYKAAITVKGRYFQLGLYDTAEAAHTAYLNAARQFHGEFACG